MRNERVLQGGTGGTKRTHALPTDEDFEYVGREKYAQIRDRGTGTVETRWKRKDGKVIDVLLSSTPVDPSDLTAGVTFTALDITERKQAEEALRKAHHELERFNLELEEKVQERTKELKQKNKQLVEAERLAALGKMANRVAHELRNPLTAIGGFARRINENAPAGDPNKKYLQVIVENVITIESKVSEITRIQSQ